MITKPPTPINEIDLNQSVFLAGSIDQGNAKDWQQQLAIALNEYNVLNPRRDEWDTSWEQSIKNPQFREQVEWELEALEKAKVIAFYFSPESKAPVSLLEMGLHAKSKKLIVYCPVGYWRKGNVDIVCARYNIETATSLDDLIQKCKQRLNS